MLRRIAGISKLNYPSEKGFIQPKLPLNPPSFESLWNQSLTQTSAPLVGSIQKNSFSTDDFPKKFPGRGRGYGARERFNRNIKGDETQPQTKPSPISEQILEPPAFKEQEETTAKRGREGEEEQVGEKGKEGEGGEGEEGGEYFPPEFKEFQDLSNEGLKKIYQQLDINQFEKGSIESILPEEILKNPDFRALFSSPLKPNMMIKTEIEQELSESFNESGEGIVRTKEAFPDPTSFPSESPVGIFSDDDYEMFSEDSDPASLQMEPEDYGTLPQVWEFYNGENSLVSELWKAELREWAPKKFQLAKLYKMVQKKHATKIEKRRQRKAAQLNSPEHQTLSALSISRLNPPVPLYHKEGTSPVYFADLMANFPKDSHIYPVLCDLFRVLALNPSFSYSEKRSAIRYFLKEIQQRIPKHNAWMQPHVKDWSSVYFEYLANKRKPFDPVEQLKMPEKSEKVMEETFW